MFDVQAFIGRHELDAADPKPWTSADGTKGRCWVLKTDPMGNGHDDGSCSIIQLVTGAISAGCHHNSATWNWDDLRSKYEPDAYRQENKTSDQPNRTIDPIVITHGVIELTATPQKPARKGAPKTVLAAKLDGRAIHRDVLDLSSARRRQDFVSAVKQASPKVNAKKLGEQLLELANRVEQAVQDAAGDGGDGGDGRISGPLKMSQATRLVEMAEEVGIELWHDPQLDNQAFMTVPVGNHLENHPLRSRGAREWLQRLYYMETRRAAGSQAMQDALGVLSAQAMFDGEAHASAVRVARSADGSIWLDLANDDWQAIRIDQHGYCVGASGGPKFIRRKAMRPLPIPRQGGSLDLVWQFFNAASADQPTTKSWLAGALNPDGPFPILSTHAEQGNCKSTGCRFLRSIIDPNDVPLRGEPSNERDLVIQARNSWICGYDNVSYISPQLSDALCRLATGGGYGVRKLYEDVEEQLFRAMRPVIINGISELATRADLLDRSLVIYLPSLPETCRRTEREMNAQFEQEHPLILGALIDAVVAGLRQLPNVKLPSLPRMADFATWAAACEAGLGLSENQFIAAYESNRSAALESALEANILATPLRAFVQRRRSWRGTADELLQALEAETSVEKQRQKGWPKAPSVLGGVLRRLAPPLRQVGIGIRFGLSHHPRTIELEWVPQTPSPPSLPSPSPPPTTTTSPTHSNTPGSDSQTPGSTPLPPPVMDGGKSTSLTDGDGEVTDIDDLFARLREFQESRASPPEPDEQKPSESGPNQGANEKEPK